MSQRSHVELYAGEREPGGGREPGNEASKNANRCPYRLHAPDTYFSHKYPTTVGIISGQQAYSYLDMFSNTAIIHVLDICVTFTGE